MPDYSTYSGTTILQKFGGETTKLRNLMRYTESDIRCAIPAKIVSVDYNEMTCSCQPLIREKIKNPDGDYTSIDLPVLLDVPIVFLGSAKYCITFPLEAGDEGLVIFADMCIDSWWQSGDVQDQFETRRHDLSDGFFIPAQMSQPRRYTGVSQQYLEVKSRTSDGKVLVDGVDVKTLKSDFDNLKSDYQSFKTTHTHHYTWTDDAGSGDTGTPN